MILTDGAKVWDLDLDDLEKHLSLVDAQLERLAADGRASGDPDGFGVFDDIDSLLGLGFVACQRYLTATCGWMKIPKHVALAVGPPHSSGMTTVQIINHAANYWKHRDEWVAGQTSPRQQRTEAAMQAIHALDSDYPMMAALGEITAGTKFKDTLRDLARWRDDLRAHKV